ncbi:Hypothetical predicted protein [Paramuricea clavata]|uniref:Uncharacterized protein n=1 Tax=Paramuricea clavata TaxID=317549 RepID=A0A6S7G5E1_PARCT|nr:Hypothetical predicted protein [Paramuricea clavata]
MSEDLDESLPFQDLESIWSCSEEDLETSMHNLSLNDEDYENKHSYTRNTSDNDKRRTSTPIQEEGNVKSPAQGKHTFTAPSTKQTPYLPPLKRVCVGKSLSGKQRLDQRKATTIVLKDGFELHDNSEQSNT